MANIIRGGGMTPDGSITISRNGTHNVEDYESAVVSVAGTFKYRSFVLEHGGSGKWSYSDELDSYNPSNNQNETVLVTLCGGSWAYQGGNFNLYVQGRNEGGSWVNIYSWNGSMTFGSFNITTVTGYRYYRLVAANEHRTVVGSMSCAGPGVS